MNTARSPKTESIVSKRRLYLAGLAAFVACAACCAIPLLVAAGVTGGAAAMLTSVLRPGAELLIGAAVFLGALGVMAIRSKFQQAAATGCGPVCSADGSCCGRGATSSW